MDETEVFAHEAAAVAMQAIADGVAREEHTREEVYQMAMQDISEARSMIHNLMEQGYIQPPPQEIIDRVFQECLAES
jgi:malate dehydrogenase (oxaloacetate-decarboxylating)